MRDSAWSRRSVEPTLTTEGKLCHQEILSQPPIWRSTPADFTCSRGTRGEVSPAAQRLERHPVDALPPDPNRDVPRRLYVKQSDFMAHGTSDRGMSNSCRVRNRVRNQEDRASESPSSCRSQSSWRRSHLSWFDAAVSVSTTKSSCCRFQTSNVFFH